MIEARRADVLGEQDRENIIREAMRMAKDLIDIVRNDLAYPTHNNLPSQNSTSTQNLPNDTEGFHAAQSENTSSVTDVTTAQNFPSTTQRLSSSASYSLISCARRVFLYTSVVPYPSEFYYLCPVSSV